MSLRRFTVTMAAKTVHGEDYGVPEVASAVTSEHLFADVQVTETLPLNDDEIQVIILPALQAALRDWLESRGLYLFRIPVEDGLPTFGIGIR